MHGSWVEGKSKKGTSFRLFPSFPTHPFSNASAPAAAPVFFFHQGLLIGASAEERVISTSSEVIKNLIKLSKPKIKIN